MSIVAEFAAGLHEASPDRGARPLRPISYPSSAQILNDVRVAVFDVYGTLFNYWNPEFSQASGRERLLLDAFGRTIDYFRMRPYLLEMNPGESAEKTLWDLYHGLISLKQEMLSDKGTEFPEVRVNEVWEAILLMLKRRGYSFTESDLGDDSELARCVAYYYNFSSFRRGLYPGAAQALLDLKKKNILLGLVSNAQFYTPIDLTLFLRDQSNGAIEDLDEVFERDLIFFSYEYSTAKPGVLLFRKLFDALYEYQALPSQTVLVGNDLAADIKPAQDAGMKTAFFTGDDQCAFLHGLGGEVIPDISFSKWDELPGRISFYEKGGGEENCLVV